MLYCISLQGKGPLCYRVYLGFSGDHQSKRYFTVEKGSFLWEKFCAPGIRLNPTVTTGQSMEIWTERRGRMLVFLRQVLRQNKTPGFFSGE